MNILISGASIEVLISFPAEFEIKFCGVVANV
jgi:hypothetical protein